MRLSNKAQQLPVCYLGAICCFCVFVFTSFGYGQDTLAPVKFEPIKIKKRYTHDPVSLARELTAGKTAEKEKFDAIFTWTVMNIHYNYRLYNSGRPNRSNNSIKRILNSRKGVCTDFALTMDTLCELAGIPNETVTGYAKEIIFDLNDTLRFDNHAWNAVKLNGLWYVYDATWCAGVVDYDYTRFGKWRIRCAEKLDKKRKLITKTLSVPGTKKDKFCGIDKTKPLDSIEVWCMPIIPGIVQRALLYFKFRLKETHYSVANSTYYLTNPELFAMTHFPNNPTWSLTPTINSVPEFSADSAFFNRYYDDPEIWKREGRFCLDCDNYYYADQVDKEKKTVSASLQNNPKNHLVPANYNLFMAETIYNKMIEVEDSLTKINFIDSTINYLDVCKEELKNSRMACRSEYRDQTAKNREKKNQLMSANKQHRTLALKVLTEARKREVKINSLTKKAVVYRRRGKQDMSTFNAAFNKSSSAKKYKEEVILKLKSEYQMYTSKSDSLNQQIRTLQDSLVPDMIALWENLMLEQEVIAPLRFSFAIDGFFRAKYSFDNYERTIIELRNSIRLQEDSLFDDVRKKVLFLSDTVYNRFTLMNNLIKQRNSIQTKQVKTMLSLRNCGQLVNDSLTTFRQAAVALMQEDACWNKDNEFLLNEVGKNYHDFLKETQHLTKITFNDNGCEIIRYNRFHKQIVRNKVRETKAIEGNIQIAVALRKAVYDHRRTYLNKLRAERKK